MNIVEPILFQCRVNPLGTAICVPGSAATSINYGTLGAMIYNISAAALRAGITPGMLIGTHIDDTILHAAATLALMHAGATTVSLRNAKPIPGIDPDVILTTQPSEFPDAQTTILLFDQSWLQGDGVAPRRYEMGSNEDTPCRISLTSGSTGLPKGVAFTHQMLAARVENTKYTRGPRFTHCSNFFCALGFATLPGIQYMIALLSRGGTIYFFGPDPYDSMQAFDLYQVRGMATTPYALSELLRYFEADPASEVTFDHIICQGAKLSPELAQRTRMRLCQNLYVSYGASEAAPVAFGPASLAERLPGAVGFILPGVTAQIVDASGRLLPPLRDGLLRVRTDAMASGYVGDEAATRAAFRDGFFYTGDLARITPDGILIITGREKAALNLGGDTVIPETVEEAITSFGGIREAAVFAQNDELGVARLCALIVADDIDENALRLHCKNLLPTSCVPDQFIIVDQLPRGGQGKLERHRLPALAAQKAT